MTKHAKPTLIRLRGGDREHHLLVNDWNETPMHGFFSFKGDGEIARILMDAVTTGVRVFVLDTDAVEWHVEQVHSDGNGWAGVRLLPHPRWLRHQLCTDDYLLARPEDLHAST